MRRTVVPEPRATADAALQALTLAALALPGLVASHESRAADTDSFEFQVGRYQEGERNIYAPSFNALGGSGDPIELDSKLKPIEVDSLHGRARFALTERLGLTLDYTQDTWSGATPLATAPVVAQTNKASVVTGASPWTETQPRSNARFFVDKNMNLYRSGDFLNTIVGPLDNQLTHTLTAASAETRKQASFNLRHEGDEFAVTTGGGHSYEADYASSFVNVGGRLDFNQKLTSLNLGLSYTHNQTEATFDPEAETFFTLNAGESLVVRDESEDVGVQVSLSQVLGKNTVVDVGAGYTNSQGYLTNPYKLVTKFDVTAPLSVVNTQPDPRFLTYITSIREKRPDSREQFNFQLGFKHYFEPLDAALRLDYRHSNDSWHIRSHALTAEWVQAAAGWTFTPRVRYYSQSAANFYLPYIGTFSVTDGSGQPVNHPLNRTVPIYYSSDHRLSGYGTLSGGLTISGKLARGVGIEVGYERYIHAGDLKLGGGGEASFADFKATSVNAALSFELDPQNEPGGDPAASVGSHSHHAAHSHPPAPAGLMFAHALDKAGDVMFGYQVMHSRQSGSMLRGSTSVDLDTVRTNACATSACETAPAEMTMTMHMLDIMVAPTDWLTLMIMPQWVDMDMRLAALDASAGGHGHGTGGGPAHGHQTGGLGDTGLAALFKLVDRPGHQLNLGLGVTAPTGDAAVALRKTKSSYASDPNNDALNQVSPALIHYGMQLGSGTWDFTPSLTYLGMAHTVSWGAQLSGVKRLERRNESNFAFGDIFQTSVWGGMSFNRWLSGTVRATYSWQGAIEGAYLPPVNASGAPLTPVHQGSADQPANYGGHFMDVGLGLSARITPVSQLSLEWLQPVRTDFNGYQLDRADTFALHFNLAL
ncbi:MAG: DUF3570 domain-containing protein [Thiobacillus sp.]